MTHHDHWSMHNAEGTQIIFKHKSLPVRIVLSEHGTWLLWREGKCLEFTRVTDAMAAGAE